MFWYYICFWNGNNASLFYAKITPSKIVPMSTLNSVKFKLHDEYLKFNPKICLYKSRVLQI